MVEENTFDIIMMCNNKMSTGLKSSLGLLKMAY